MKIKDIKNITLFNDQNKDAAKKRKQTPQNEISPEKKLVAGMSRDAYSIHQEQRHDMTREELGVSDKRIIIPSFWTTSKLFAQHFSILRELKHRIDLLK